MRVGIMQPYFFPYIGYWQLIAAVEKYVVYDDVNFISGGWINRNYILTNGKPSRVNIHLRKASQNRLIHEIEVVDDQNLRTKTLKSIEHSYKKAPHFENTYGLIEKILRYDETNLSKFLEFSIRSLSTYLAIDTEIILSSSLNKREDLRGEEKILEICKILSGNEYVNAIGGQNLYSQEKFLRNGIKLLFLESEDITYPQFGNIFVPRLSIIDVLMFNSIEKIRKLLDSYKMIE